MVHLALQYQGGATKCGVRLATVGPSSSCTQPSAPESPSTHSLCTGLAFNHDCVAPQFRTAHSPNAQSTHPHVAVQPALPWQLPSLQGAQLSVTLPEGHHSLVYQPPVTAACLTKGAQAKLPGPHCWPAMRNLREFGPAV